MTKEKAYNQEPFTEPELLPANKIRKHPRLKAWNFEDAKIIFVNFQFENSYNHIMTKLISLVAEIPTHIQALIVSLPPEATFCDSHLAEQF